MKKKFLIVRIRSRELPGTLGFSYGGEREREREYRVFFIVKDILRVTYSFHCHLQPVDHERTAPTE